MTDSNMLKVLLYSDGTHYPFSAAVYTASLSKSIPNMHITVLHVKESDEGSYSREHSLTDTWPNSVTADWMKQVMDDDDDDSDLLTQKQYQEILNKTNEIFTERGLDVSHHVIYCNPSISDTVDALLDYATKKSFQLIIMGTRGLTSLKGVIYGSLAYTMLNRSPIPVMLVKKLPQEFIDRFCSNTD